MDGKIYDVPEGMEIVGGNPNPSLADLNKRAISKLYELIDGLDGKSEPDLVRACIESLSKFNSSLKGSNILPNEETPEEKAERKAREAITEAMGA